MHVKPTSYRDRTHEFESIAEKLKKPSSLLSASTAPSSSSGGGDGNSISAAPEPEPTRSSAPIQSEFGKKSSRISLGIHRTSQKLSKLAKLAKKTSVFDDQHWRSKS